MASNRGRSPGSYSNTNIEGTCAAMVDAISARQYCDVMTSRNSWPGRTLWRLIKYRRLPQDLKDKLLLHQNLYAPARRNIRTFLTDRLLHLHDYLKHCIVSAQHAARWGLQSGEAYPPPNIIPERRNIDSLFGRACAGCSDSTVHHFMRSIGWFGKTTVS